jgi:hypothetical protein
VNSVEASLTLYLVGCTIFSYTTQTASSTPPFITMCRDRKWLSTLVICWGCIGRGLDRFTFSSGLGGVTIFYHGDSCLVVSSRPLSIILANV